MTEIKLPLPRVTLRTGPNSKCADTTDVVHDCDVRELEAAYAELQERCANAVAERDEARAERDLQRMENAVVRGGGEPSDLVVIKALRAEVERLRCSVNGYADYGKMFDLATQHVAAQTELLERERDNLRDALDRFDAEMVTFKAERDEARAEVERLRDECIVEVASHNVSVREYCTHWESRATKAEAEVERLKAMYETAGQCKDCGNAPPGCQTCWAQDKREIAALKAEVERLKVRLSEYQDAYCTRRIVGVEISEHERLKRIEAAAADWAEGAATTEGGFVAQEILAGRGSDGEVRP